MKHVSISFIFLLAIFLMLANTQTAFTQWSPYPNENNIICAATGGQIKPSVVNSWTGYSWNLTGAFVFWIDDRGPESRIYYQLISKDGELRWPYPDYGQPACGIGFQSSFTVIEDGAGGCIVAWRDEMRNPSPSIYAQRMDANGAWLWEYNGKLVHSSGTWENMKLVSDGAGGAIIIWEEYRENGKDIVAQRVSAVGAVVWGSPYVIICDAINDQENVVAVTDGSGGAIIAWQGTCCDDIYAQRVNGSGSVQWTPNGIPICNAVVDVQWNPNIVSDGVGGAIIQWIDVRDYDGWLDIYMQRVNANGVTRWAENGILVCSTVPDGGKAAMVSSYAGSATVAWEDSRSGGRDIYAQRVDSTGVPDWTAGGVAVCTWAAEQNSPKLIYDGSDGAIIVWNDFRNGSNCDIYGQRISGGSSLWTTDGIPISNANNDQGGTDEEDNVDIIQINYGAIVVWNDERNFSFGSSMDIYASRVNWDGQLGLSRDTWRMNYSFETKNEGMGFKIPTDAKKMTRNIAMDRYGNTYVTGYGEGNGTKMDYITIKYDNSGNQLWAVRYDGAAHKKDMAYGLSLDPEYGDVYVTGESEGSTTKSDIVTIKYNTNGEQQWIARYDNPTVHKMDVGHAVLISHYGGDYVWVTGYSDAGITNKSDYITIGYDPSTGTQLWVQTYNGTGSKVDKAYALCETEDGRVVVTGESDGGKATKADYATISYSGHDGYQEWVQRYNGPTSKKDYAFAISSIGDSWRAQVIVTGGSEGSTKFDYATIAYSSDGEQNWVARYDGMGKKDIAYDLVTSLDDIVYVTGASEGIKYDYRTVAYDVNSGTQIWVNVYYSDGGKSDIARSVSMAFDYNYYLGTKLIVTGSSDQGKNRKLDIVTTCINAATGATVWTGIHNADKKDDIGYSCAVRWDEGTFAIAGLVTNGSKKDIVTIHGPIGSAWPFWTTTPTIPETEASDELPASFRLAQNYPNPFNPTTTIEFDLPQQSIVTLKVYNMLGQEVAMLLDHEDMEDGTQEAEFNASTLSSGVYFYRLIAEPVAGDDDETPVGTFIQVKKMLMLK